ncbi:hypothetical protein Tco_0978100 [Tanacetum coccineum]|uniref:Integrase, catalytic region, zinc finger, CCHC-type, peptidase aspartic, catalytic n=1 Tax=Tanacetum coccineum TaxID=301880 RepID=A0ABQ5EM04_9ASTR
MYPPSHPSQPQISHSSIPPSQQYQSYMNHQISSVPQIAYHSPLASTQPMTEAPKMDSGSLQPTINLELHLIRETNPLFKMAELQCNKFRGGKGKVIMVLVITEMLLVLGETIQADRQGLLNAITVKEKAMLAEAQEAGQILDEEQLACLADPDIPDGQAAQKTIPNNVAFQTEDLDTYDSDCDDVSNAKAVLMANLSNYGSEVISDVPYSETYHNNMENQSVHAMQDFEQTPVVDFTNNEITSDSNIIIKESLLQTFTVFKNESKEKESKYMENEIDLEKKIKELDNIVYKVGQQTVHMLTKPQVFYDNAHKQALVEVPSELPKVSLVNESLKKIKLHLAKFDSVVKIRTTPDALTEGEWGFEHTKTVFINEIIPFLKSLKDIFNVFDKDILNEITKVQIVFNQMEAVVQQCSVDKQCFEIVKKELFLENDRLLQKIMSQDVLLSVMNTISLNGESVNVEMQKKRNKEEKVNHDRSELETIIVELENSVAKLLSENERLCKEINHVKQVFKDQFDSIKKTLVRTKEQSDSLIAKLNLKYVENEDLKAQIQDKVFVITSLKNDLRKLKGKEIVENVAQTPTATTISPGMFQLDLDTISHKLKNNMDALENYIKKTTKYTNTIRGIVERARQQTPRLKRYTSDSRSKPTGNKKNDRILPLQSCPYCSLVSGLRMFKTYDRESLSAHELPDARQKPDLSFLHVFGSLCYLANDSEDLGKLNAKADIGVEELPKTPYFHNDPLHETLHADSTSQGSPSNVRLSHTPYELIGRRTKDHPIANVIGDPSRFVSTRKQLQTDAMWCYFDAFLTSVEPKNFKQAMNEPSWIDAMQEEIHEFERLEV